MEVSLLVESTDSMISLNTLQSCYCLCNVMISSLVSAVGTCTSRDRSILIDEYFDHNIIIIVLVISCIPNMRNITM